MPGSQEASPGSEAFDWLSTAALWLVLDKPSAGQRRLADLVTAAVQGGVDAVVFRHKSSPFTDVLHEAHAVREVCCKGRIPFVLSHEVSLAARLQPDALHFGSASSPVSLRSLRQELPAVKTFGFSAHSVAEAAQRAGEGYDYCFLGPLYPTPSKQGMGQPLGSAAYANALARLPGFPLVAIGGIALGKLEELRDAVDQARPRIAVVGAIHQSDCPANAARQLRRLLEGDRRQ